jgi:hypothetical protein
LGRASGSARRGDPGKRRSRSLSRRRSTDPCPPTRAMTPPRSTR